MKKTLLFSALFVMQFLFAQQQIDLTIKYSVSNSRYEVFAKPNFTQNNFTWGPSQISIVVPASFPDQSLLITAFAGGSWGDNSKVYAPTVSPSVDYHGVSSNGQQTNLVANQEILVFSFLPPSGACVDGLRLFVNSTDPNSSQPGMAGGDFRNSIDNGALTDIYNANYNNNGTSCTLSNATVDLSELNIVVYPNPVISQLTISGLTTASNNVEIYAYNGKLLKSFNTNESELKLDFSAYTDGVYLIKIQNADNKFTVQKIIKQP
ncbi:T9SS type A sorting domain-containing protein [Flavobacterium gelidilacus]|jgi:hypothetical protein|uniref:T9SS type A sorting domain-containing protein n=1 Tax=Flavobacterium gelidilacus TaxID=206041 RepID=UPI000A0258CA|nr:T9SS type A sorting domain-containing protein [Flavobacterium gelidilacus]